MDRFFKKDFMYNIYTNLPEVIQTDIENVFPYALRGCGYAFVFALLYISYFILCHKKQIKVKLRPISALSICFILIYFTVMIQRVLLSRVPGSLSEIEVIPFSTWKKSIWDTAFFIENIIMFIPFGFLFPIAFKKFRSFFVCIGAAFFLSFSFEMIQLLFAVGFTQTDDIITNVFGSIIGYCAFGSLWIVYKLFAGIKSIIGKK